MDYQISLVDYLVIILYLLGIFFMAFKSGRLSQAKSDDNFLQHQYLGGKDLSIVESLASIIATEVSALTFLGIPAFAFARDYSFLHIYLGAIFARYVIARLFLPLIYDKGLTIYSVMGKTGTPGGQRTTAIFYFLNKILAVGVRLFSGSILVAEFFDMNIYLAILIISVITFFYTLIGGLKAVVRTDLAQMLLFVTGGIIAHFVITDLSGHSWAELMSMASVSGKTTILDFSNPWPFITGIIGGFLFDMATHGVDQDFVQRLTGNRTIKGAKIAIISSSFLSIIVALIFLGVGSLLWSYYQLNPIPEGVNPDKLFAYFITHHFPIGLKGLMVAGVLAATMSTLDSTINALSASFYNDIFSHKERSTEKISWHYKVDTLLITGFLLIVAFISSKSDELLLLGLKITSWTSGPLLALFASSVLWNHFYKSKLDMKTVLGAYAFGIAAVYLNLMILEWNWLWNMYFGFGAASIYIILFSKFRKH